MAIKNKVITNPVSGQTIIFLQTASDTGGSLLEMESHFAPHSHEPPPHYHPHQEEYFKVEYGELTVRIDGQLKTYKPGDVLHVPKYKIHSMWNQTGAPAKVNWKVYPALDTEYLLETAMGLAASGKTNAKGIPPLFQVALTGNRFAHVFRLAHPPFLLQRLLFILLTPFALLAGYRPTYKQYLD